MSIHKRMLAVMQNIGAVSKDAVNTQQGFKFRGIDQLINASHPAFLKAGVFCTPEVLDRKEVLKDVTRSNGKPGVDKHVSLLVKFTFWAEDGTFVSSTIAAEGVDSGDKATNKALSAALKYALIQTFSVPTEDMEDSDKTTIELGTERTKVSAAPLHSIAADSAAGSTPLGPAATPSFRKSKPTESVPQTTTASKKERWS